MSRKFRNKLEMNNDYRYCCSTPWLFGVEGKKQVVVEISKHN